MEKKGTALVRVKILADESRALAARLQGKAAVKVGKTPIIVASLPKAVVSSESLPLLPGAAAAKAARITPAVVEPLAAAASPPDLGKVKLLPVAATRIFVQAGSFSLFTNANKVRAKLSWLGPVRIFPVLVNGQDMFRVRVGPMDSVASADHMLDRVIGVGYTDSHIVVE
jgi:rare lipoprotein A